MKNTIRDRALSFVGEEEIEGNKGFKNDNFQKRMEEAGWEEGFAWCSYFVEMVCGFSEGFSGSAVQTFNNFKKQNLTSRNPKIGSLIVWQTYKKGKAHWSGHIGVVAAIDRGQIITVEGNTNNSGGREGYKVALKIRQNDFTVKNGLTLIGYINVSKIIDNSKGHME